VTFDVYFDVIKLANKNTPNRFAKSISIRILAMRTTLDLDEDILYVAKQLAQQQRKSMGQVVSELVRDALSAKLAIAAKPTPAGVSEPLHQYGIFPLPNRGAIVSNELVNKLRDDEGI
jgi:hypothetical protein